MNEVARALVAAFQKIESDAAGAVLLEDDGFDLASARVLTAWMHVVQPWSAPRPACPDGGRPTPSSYAWLMSGLKVNDIAIADAAGVSRATARGRVRMLIGNRLVYPDCIIAKVARAALEAALAVRVAEASGGGGGGGGSGRKMAALERSIKALDKSVKALERKADPDEVEH